MPEGGTLFERACRGERGDRVPVWVMRQAGRYLPEYRALREKVDFLTATKTPEVAARITLQPMQRFPLDAAILFADIMTPLEGMGVEVEFAPGPIVRSPVRSVEAARSLRPLTPEADTPFVLEALRLVRAELARERALIAFAGAPFTLFCYLVEGRGSKDFMEARRFLRAEPGASDGLLELLATSMARYLVAQARAGADALMLFDSWVGLLAPETYRRHVLPVLRRLVRAVREQVDRPVIYFAHGGATLLTSAAEVGADVLGVDWTLPLAQAVGRLGPSAVVQGNLDPAALFADPEDLIGDVDRVLAGGVGAAAHIFNLGHGIHHATDPGRVALMIDRVHASSTALLREGRVPAESRS